ncbi:hypothetical protein [Kitasatospora sp. NPDC088779]|uniref:hypothetical protein n=1 Tax=Kitasatospora sp. NPDC088779 TaxID=3154964 RepID=UPI0034171F47
MDGWDAARRELGRQLSVLREAADQPGLASLSGRLKASGFEVGTSALGEWFKGRRSPSDTRAVLRLAEILDVRAQERGRTAVVALGRLKELVEAAQRESGRQRGGRPPNPALPTTAAGTAHGTSGEHVARARTALAAYVSPALLSGRGEELRELEAFCTAPQGTGSSYAWWQAGPWTGKSALMAHLVTRTRPRGVDFVAYFISEVLQNNNREAFHKDLWKQLCGLAGRPAGRAGGAEELFALMEQAGQACRDRGRRLILVVDALDEDAGARPGGASIAALLPKNPPAGMRVLVTGRPNPPLPDDVPTDHPLREAAAIRRLEPWAGARGIEEAATRDIQHLLHSELGRTVLGLLAAAHGALNRDDLAELAQVPPFEVDRILRSTTGRSLIPAASPYRPTATCTSPGTPSTRTSTASTASSTPSTGPTLSPSASPPSNSTPARLPSSTPSPPGASHDPQHPRAATCRRGRTRQAPPTSRRADRRTHRHPSPRGPLPHRLAVSPLSGQQPPRRLPDVAWGRHQSVPSRPRRPGRPVDAAEPARPVGDANRPRGSDHRGRGTAQTCCRLRQGAGVVASRDGTRRPGRGPHRRRRNPPAALALATF